MLFEKLLNGVVSVKPKLGIKQIALTPVENL